MKEEYEIDKERTAVPQLRPLEDYLRKCDFSRLTAQE